MSSRSSLGFFLFCLNGRSKRIHLFHVRVFLFNSLFVGYYKSYWLKTDTFVSVEFSNKVLNFFIFFLRLILFLCMSEMLQCCWAGSFFSSGTVTSTYLQQWAYLFRYLLHLFGLSSFIVCVYASILFWFTSRFRFLLRDMQ